MGQPNAHLSKGDWPKLNFERTGIGACSWLEEQAEDIDLLQGLEARYYFGLCDHLPDPLYWWVAKSTLLDPFAPLWELTH